jgi:hypothetical protein
MKITKSKLKLWNRDKTLIFVGVCRKCGKVHEIRNEIYNVNCTCKNNIIWHTMINHFGIEVVFRNKLLKSDSVKNFTNRWKK